MGVGEGDNAGSGAWSIRHVSSQKREAAERLRKERGVDLMPPISRNLQLFSCGQVAFFLVFFNLALPSRPTSVVMGKHWQQKQQQQQGTGIVFSKSEDTCTACKEMSCKSRKAVTFY